MKKYIALNCQLTREKNPDMKPITLPNPEFFLKENYIVIQQYKSTNFAEIGPSSPIIEYVRLDIQNIFKMEKIKQSSQGIMAIF